MLFSGEKDGEEEGDIEEPISERHRHSLEETAEQQPPVVIAQSSEDNPVVQQPAVAASLPASSNISLSTSQSTEQPSPRPVYLDMQSYKFYVIIIYFKDLVLAFKISNGLIDFVDLSNLFSCRTINYNFRSFRAVMNK